MAILKKTPAGFEIRDKDLETLGSASGASHIGISVPGLVATTLDDAIAELLASSGDVALTSLAEPGGADLIGINTANHNNYGSTVADLLGFMWPYVRDATAMGTELMGIAVTASTGAAKVPYANAAANNFVVAGGAATNVNAALDAVVNFCGDLQIPDPGKGAELVQVNLDNVSFSGGTVQNILENHETRLETIEGRDAFRRVDRIVLGANATSVTFSGLSGNTSGKFLIVIRAIAGVTTPDVRLRPNGLTGGAGWYSWRTNSFSSGSQSVDAGGTEWTLIGGDEWGAGAGVGEWGGQVTILAGAGRERRMWSVGISASGANYRDARRSGIWTDTATNITSIAIVSLQADGLGAGSEFTLYEVVPV